MIHSVLTKFHGKISLDVLHARTHARHAGNKVIDRERCKDTFLVRKKKLKKSPPLLFVFNQLSQQEVSCHYTKWKTQSSLEAILHVTSRRCDIEMATLLMISSSATAPLGVNITNPFVQVLYALVHSVGMKSTFQFLPQN